MSAKQVRLGVNFVLTGISCNDLLARMGWSYGRPTIRPTTNNVIYWDKIASQP